MELSREERALLQEGLLAAYSYDDLARLLDFELDIDIGDVAPLGSSRTETFRRLIRLSIRQGWTARLLAALRADSENPTLRDALERIGSPTQSVIISSPVVLLPRLERGMIDRLGPLDSLISLVKAGAASDIAPVVAVHGPGGFGKTTLISQVCRTREVEEHFTDILWVETGQDCTPARILQLIFDLCVHLGALRPEFMDPDQAGFHLGNVIGERRALLVVDNVWSATDLGPFLLGAPNCTRLVSTRNVRVCPADARLFRLGGMTQREIAHIVRGNLGTSASMDLDTISDMCGGWPLLARVVATNLGSQVAGGFDARLAIEEICRELEETGPASFDVVESSSRANAVRVVMRSSLQSLDEQISINDSRRLGLRYLDLGIFPASVPIPIDVLTVWWGREAGWPPNLVRQFCKILEDRSLVDAYEVRQRCVALHDVFRAFLKGELGGSAMDRHGALIEAYRDEFDEWWRMPSDHLYMWQYLSYHMAEAGLDHELIDLLSDPRYILAKVGLLGYDSLVGDAAALRSVNQPLPADPRRHLWSAAMAFTQRAHLLRGLERRADMAATLLAALLLESAEATTVVQGLRALAPAAAFDPRWVHRLGADSADGHVGAVTDVTSSADTVVSAGEDGTVRIYDPAQPRLRDVLYGAIGWLYAVRLDPSGSLIASAGEDKVVRIWDARTGKIKGSLLRHSRRIRALAFDSTGDVLVSAAEDGRVCIWHVRRTMLVTEIATPDAPLWSVAVSPDDRWVVTGGQDEYLRIYDLATGAMVDERPAHRDWIRSVSFSRTDSGLIATASGDRTVRLWRVADSGQLEAGESYDTGEFRPRCVRIAGDAVLAGDEDAILHRWRGGQHQSVRMPANVDWIRGFTLHDERDVIIGCEDGGVRRLRLDGLGLTDIAAGAKAVWSAEVGADGQVALLGRSDGRLDLHEARTGDYLRSLDAGTGRVWSMAVSGPFAAAACGDGAVRLWRFAQGEPVRTITPPERRTWSVALYGKNGLIAASSGRGRLWLWRIEEDDPRWDITEAHEGRIRSLVFLPSGDRLASAGGDGKVRVWSVEDGSLQRELSLPGSWVRLVASAPTGDLLAAGLGSGDIVLWDWAQNRLVRRLVGHSGRILMISFSTDGRKIISASADGTVRLWSTESGTEIAELRCDSSLLCAGFGPNSGLALVSTASSVFAVDVKTGD